MNRPGSKVRACLSVCLGVGALACATEPAPSSCEEAREIVDADDAIVQEQSANALLQQLNTAPPAILTWHSPAILDDGIGVPELELEHVGECDSPLQVEAELRDADILWVAPEPDVEAVCGAAALLIPVRLRLATDDGLLEFDVDDGVTVNADGDIHFAVSLDGVPEPLGSSLAWTGPALDSELMLEARLVNGELHGELHLYRHDCTPAGPCDFWADYILATFD